MVNFGKVKPGSTLYIPFHTFDSNDPSASVTITGLATTDIEVYKDGGNTARASDAGYALLGTDGIDEYGTGIHGFSIDLADNTTPNFYEAGSFYHVVIASITVDAATVNFIAATFIIGYEGAILDTTIATLSSQTEFTLEDGSADNSSYNGCIAVVHDLASAVQVASGVVSAYTGVSKTVTLKADPGIFTMAAGDNISLFPPALVPTTLGNTLDVTSTGAAGIDWGNVENPTTAVDLSGTDIQLCDTTTTNSDMRGTDSAALASVCTEARLAELDAANLPTDVAGVQSDTDDIQTRLPAALVNGRMDANTSAINDNNNAAVRLALSAGQIIPGTVDNSAHTPTTTEFEADDITTAAADHYNGRIVIFTGGTLAGQATDITDYSKVGSNGHFTVTALTSEPTNNDTFVIV